jgi:hypothetical protein
MNPLQLAKDLEPTAAVSLVVRAPDAPGRILMGVRSPTPTSRRHPNVLSTPTMRVSHGAFNEALAEHAAGPWLPSAGIIKQLPDSSPVPFGGAQTLATTVAFIVESILARKLGVADALVLGTLHGRAVPVATAVDDVPDEATGESERTHMLTIAVDLVAGETTAFPSSTPSYSRLLWVEAERLAHALEHNDPLHLAADLDLMVCLHGLCVRSAAQVAA